MIILESSKGTCCHFHHGVFYI